MPDLLTSVTYFAGGALLWTFLEYFLHRFLGHWKKGRNDFTREHLRHHRETNYFAPAYKKAIAATIVVSLVAAVTGFLSGRLQGISFALGLGIMYTAYEFIHKRAHTHAPINFYGRWLRKHHFYHHFKDPKKNHGVTSPIWDIVFGTNVNPGVVTVPRALSPPWLIDGTTGKILPEYAEEYKTREDTPVP
ncbi:MAG TPA: sterol desaturase family protein [Chitinophagales bacterium]|nr:sterol desaturase family protein [Chitinophagales bacterium]